LRFVAAITRTSMRIFSLPPSRSNAISCNTRRIQAEASGEAEAAPGSWERTRGDIFSEDFLFTRPLLAVASYSGPPAVRASLTGHFFVPIAPDGTSEEEIQKRLASNSNDSIPTTAVHEAYPGHHWHITWSKIHAQAAQGPQNAVLLRLGAVHEQVIASELFEDRSRAVPPQATIFRAARIVMF
jgi:hypothetical protein